MPSIMEEQVNKAGNEEEEEDDDDDDGAIRIGDIYIPPPPLPCLSFDPTGPRLMISDIVIENFKSYGGKVALGPFQKNFSAIVGPNGSGKSNVIDSMLFVFGYRAQKIRSQTVGVLIHSSDTHPNVTSCSVNVHFQKIVDKLGDDFDVVKGSEFAISRTAYKDNSSYYSINNRKVPFKEVSRMLRSFGIDLDHNRFLILQGEVEQISLMKPKSPNEHDTGMLEFLEDIIGSGRFKEPIELLAKKVEELNELRTEKLKRVKAVEKEKDELEGPKNEAIEYMNWKNQLTVKHHALTQKYMYECKQKIEEKFQKKKSIETEQSEFLANFDKIAKEIETAEKERTALLKEFANVCKAHEENQTKVNELDILDLQRREDVKHTSGKLKEMVLSLEKEKKKLDDLETVPTKLEEEISSLRKRLDDELAKQKIKFEENEQRVMASLQNETKDIQAEKDKQEQTLMELQKPVDEAGAKVGIAQVELDLYTKNAQNEENRLMEIQAAIEKNVTAIKEMETEIRSLSVELPRIEELVSRDVAELKAVTISETRATEMFKSRRMKLEEMRNAMQTSHSRGRILEALMREKAAGRIPGIVGRLGDLGAIEEKYDIAISTACRPLDNIVTETLTSAEDCVSFLKQHNLGQATFIALDKMQSWNEHIKRKFSPPRGVCRLFDLIEVKDESVLPAFYFALRDTLVANDIDQATAIGLQGMTRYRVVTLKGELIETSGTMSGGGNRPMRGRMGTSVVADAVSAEQVEEVQREVNQLQKSLEELTPKKQALQEGINTQERLAQQMKHTIQKRKMEFEGITQQQKVLKVQLKEQEKRVEATTPDERKIRELTENLKREKNVFDEADRAASNVKAVIQRLHDQIMEISGSKFKAAQKQLHDVNEQIDEATGAINKKMVGIKTAKRNFSKLREKIANIEAEIEESKEKMANLKKVLKEAEDIARNLFEVLGKLKVERTEIEKTLSLVSGRAEKSKAEVQEMKSRKMDIDHELKQLTDALHIEESRMNTWKKDLSKMGLEQIEGTETLELKTLGEDELKEFDMKACNYVITVLDENLKKAKPNLAAIAEYCRKEEVYLQRVEEMDKMTKERDAQRSHHDGLRKQRLTEFMKGFGIITQKLKETYQMLTLGGDAELELVNSLDPFSDGIVFSVRPPRKSWKNISNLSGGEKTLSSLALVFALHYFKPTPFYVMDEIDAALDFRNVTIVGHYIKEQTKNAQFIVISLRNNMFELADRLVGVYKTYNTSHSVAIDPRTASNNAPGS